MELKQQLVLSGNELTIREGKAVDPLPLKEPKIINLSGDIHTVSAFLLGRLSGHSSQGVEKDKAIVVVDKVARTIQLFLDPENHYGASVLAKLEMSPELAAFRINTDERWDRKRLAQQLKFNGAYFEDKILKDAIVAGLYKLRIKTEKEIQQEQDNAGNRKNSVEVNVIDDNGFERFFTLNIPLFKGFRPEKFQVEICYEVLDNSVSFWLESVGMRDMMIERLDGILADELKNCEGFVIIHK